MSPRTELLRLALAGGGGVVADPSGRLPGRGAYICLSTGPTCLWTALRRRSLGRSLRATLDLTDNERLTSMVALLTPKETPSSPR